MPQLVEHTVPASQVRQGDIVRQVGHLKGHVLCGHTVVAAETKTKLSHITPVGGIKVTIPLDTQVLVQREEQTPEERAEFERTYALAYIRREIDNAPEEVIEAKAALIKDLDYLPSAWAYRLLDLSKAKVHAYLWSCVARAAEAGAYRGSDQFEPGDLIAATMAVAAEIKEGVADLRPTSRSTSVVHNALEDAELEAKLSWVRGSAIFDTSFVVRDPRLT